MPWGLIEVTGFFLIILVLAIADLRRTQAQLKKDREQSGDRDKTADDM
jgi:hypothetical protein